MDHSRNHNQESSEGEELSSVESKLKSNSLRHRLLLFLRDHKDNWVSTVDIFGTAKPLPSNANYIPAKLYRNGWIDKKSEHGRSILKITQAGLDQLTALSEESANSDLSADQKMDGKNSVGSVSQASEPPKEPELLEEPELSGVVRDRKKIMKFLFYENALSVDSAITPNYVANKLNIPTGMVSFHLKKLVTDHHALKNTIEGYYLTREGIPVAESLILGGDEFVEDTLEAFILNPLGRKVLHILAEGMTVNQIAEKIGYNVESTLYDNHRQEENEIEYGLKKTYHIVDRLYRHGLIDLAFHHVEKSTQITRINHPEVLNILRSIAILIEYIPTLLVENDQYYSVLRWLMSPVYQKTIDKQLKMQFYEVNSTPEELKRKVAYAERCAYWLNTDKLEAEVVDWRDAGIVKNAGKHYYMVKRRTSKQSTDENE